MRVIFFFIIALFAILIGYLINQDAGYVLVAYQHWQIETSLWVAIAAIILLYLIVKLCFSLISWLLGIGPRLRLWGKARNKHRAFKQQQLAIAELIAGKFDRAKRYFEKAAKSMPLSLANYLGMAEAEQGNQRYAKRDQALQKAQKRFPKSAFALRLLQAKWQIEAKQWEQALATLNYLDQRSPNNPEVSRLLIKVNQALHDWSALSPLLNRAKKLKLFDEEKQQMLEQATAIRLLQHATQKNLTAIDSTWHELSNELKKLPLVVHQYFVSLQSYQQTANCQKLIERTLKHSWDAQLVLDYGDIPQDDNVTHRLNQSQQWLKHHRQAELLLTLGKLSLQADLQGQAKAYLEESIQLKTLEEARHLLATLYQKEGKLQQALLLYQAQ